MGKRSREIRSSVKSLARSCGYKETELGELKPVVSKAEARRRFLTWKWDLSCLIIEPLSVLRAFYAENKLAIQRELISSLSVNMSREMDAEIFALV